MARVLITPTARESRLTIWQQIAESSVTAADRVIDAVNDRCQYYSQNPFLAQARPELGPGIRSFVVGKYVVIYRPIENGIEVLLVIHGARDIPQHFRVAMRQLRADIEPKQDEGRG